MWAWVGSCGLVTWGARQQVMWGPCMQVGAAVRALRVPLLTAHGDHAVAAGRKRSRAQPGGEGPPEGLSGGYRFVIPQPIDTTRYPGQNHYLHTWS